MSDDVQDKKSKLTVVLKADDAVVTEVTDAILWQRVLQAIYSGNPDAVTTPKAPQPPLGAPPRNPAAQAGQPIEKLAHMISVSSDLIAGAMDPSPEAPYLRLNLHNWSAMKEGVPSTGLTALAPIVLSTTLLALWFRQIEMGNPTQAQAQAVLGEINARDRNATRGIRRATWLQPRPGGQVALNPAGVQRAIRIARCFCTQDWSEWANQS